MRLNNRLVKYLLGGATLISFASTAFGLFAWFHAESTFAEAAAFALAWSLFLQAGIVVFWTYVGRAESAIGVTFAVLLAVACSLGSMTFASAVWLMRTNRTGYESTLTHANAEALIAPVMQLGARVNNVSATMTDLAATAATKAQTETVSGGTCEGVKPVKDCGPICRMRKREQADATKLSEELGNFAQRTTDIVSSIQGDLTRDGLKNGYTKAAALGRQPELARARAWLDSEIRGYDGKFVDPQTGASFVCRDPAFHDQLAAARKTLDADLSLPALPPEPAHVGYADAAAKSVNDVLSLVRAVVTLSISKATLLSLQDSIIGLGIAAFIEHVIVFLVLVEARDYARRAVNATPVERFIFTKRAMPREQIERLAEFGRVIDRLTFRSNTMRESFFLRPLDGKPEVVAQCSDIVRLFNLPFAKDQVKIVPRDIIEDWANANDDLTGGARRFEVRVLTKQLDNQLRIIARDALLLAPVSPDGRRRGQALLAA